MRSVRKIAVSLGVLTIAIAPPLSGVLSGPVGAAPSQSEQKASEPRAVLNLSSGWKFRKGDAEAAETALDDSDWETVSVPHSWNRIGIYEAAAGVPGMAGRTIDKYMGPAWYRRTFNAAAPAKGRRIWLEFDAASRTAQVWLNGKLLGSHRGSFARFRLDATDALKAGANLLAVRVDNSQPAIGNTTADTLPLLGDFVVQGGLYRPVRLIETAESHFTMDDFGGPGVYGRTEAITDGEARLSVLSRLSHQGEKPMDGMLSTRLIAADGRIAAEATQPVKIGRGDRLETTQTLTVSQPHLWQGTSDPYLYTLQSELRDTRGAVLDRTNQNFGIRQFRIDPAQGLFLNGQHIAVHGVGLHQDAMDSGWAMSPQQVEDRVATIRDMGANSIRLTHYQHGQPIHDLADRYGLILWDEISLVTAWTLDPAQPPAPAEIKAQATLQLQELIRQNYNHPSVAVWGIANEVDFGAGRPDFLGKPVAKPSDPSPFLAELAQLVAKEDPSRPATLATCCERGEASDIPIVADVVPVSGANRYFAWYYGKVEELGPHLDQLFARRPGQPQSLTEYGAGGAFSIHTDNPLGGPVDPGGRDQPEEYQSWVHEQSWPIIASKQQLWGSWLWNSFDFATSFRREGDTADINTKGLVSYDGQIRKDAFYYYRAQWSDRPTVHITGRRYVNRAYPAVDVRAYSNAATTELHVNGRSLGLRSDCPNRICVWHNVALDSGANQLAASAQFPGVGAVTDSVQWNLDSARSNTFRIDSGALVASVGFGSDNFFIGGDAGSADKRGGRGKPPVLAPIAPAARRTELASFREGTFSYRLPLKPGRYVVTLSFVEPSAKPGERVFDVRAGGVTRLKAVDVASESAGPFSAVTRSFEVTIKSDGLTLDFAPVRGKALVSTVEVSPARRPRK